MNFREAVFRVQLLAFQKPGRCQKPGFFAPPISVHQSSFVVFCQVREEIFEFPQHQFGNLRATRLRALASPPNAPDRHASRE